MFFQLDDMRRASNTCEPSTRTCIIQVVEATGSDMDIRSHSAEVCIDVLKLKKHEN